MNVMIVGLWMVFFSSGGVRPEARPLAFPGADGFGRFASGGRGGKVMEVTNLADSGPGSLRWAMEEQGSRTIVFRISGTIPLESALVITNGDLTIAGQTAPGDGICVKNYPTIIHASNVIIRYMRFRLGDERAQVEDALTVMYCDTVIIDHCSMSWGIDETCSCYDNRDFTLQWCIISESLYNSYHYKGHHGFGGIWGGERASFHHNLLAHHSSRNPRFQGGRSPRTRTTELVDFRNNVVYNWGYECAYGGEMGKQNVVENLFKPGPATRNPLVFLEPSDSLGRWYVEGNVLVGSPEAAKDNWTLGVRSPYGTRIRSDQPFPIEISKTETAQEAFESVLGGSGATLPRRDELDSRIIRETRQGNATYGDDSYAKDYRIHSSGAPLGIIDSQTSVGGWPELVSVPAPPDGDHDGIPDAWESANGLDPHNANDGRMVGSGGYTNLERYLHSLERGGD